FVAVVEAVRGPLPRRAALALTALLVPFATLLSPSFDLAFALSSYADHATAVAAATAAVLGWRGLDALAAGERPAARALAWQFGLALALILNLKQTGPVVAALLLGGLGLIVLRDPRLRLRDALAMLPAMVLPGLLVYGVWRLYVGANIPGGETVVRPLAAWHLHIVPEILASAWKQMREHPAHFLLMWGAALYGGYAFLRMRDGLDRLAALTAIVWLGFTAFMGIAYLSMFSEPESKEAAQYWRYSGQVGLLGSVLAVALLARHWPSRWRQALRPAAATAAIAFPLAVIVLAESLSPALRPLPRAFREFGREMAEILPDNARVASLEPWGYGLMYFAVKYDLWRPGRDDRGLRVVKQIDFLFSKAEENLPWTAAAFADPGVTHIVINDTPPEYAAILGIPPQKATAVLLEKGEAGWRIVKSWPRRPGPNGKTE
ncbi:MAG TPA: hypothetical protein VEH84_05100, partial [Alphaproteobacteria bacterium]|nr:hypothetical protein [Alphaproteobacteria bacterium]